MLIDSAEWIVEEIDVRTDVYTTKKPVANIQAGGETCSSGKTDALLLPTTQANALAEHSSEHRQREIGTHLLANHGRVAFLQLEGIEVMSGELRARTCSMSGSRAQTRHTSL